MLMAKSEKVKETKSSSEKLVKSGDTVSLDYEGKLETGEVFDSSKHGDHSHPLEFEAGSGQVIAGFDSAVMGMKIGEEKEFEIAPENAYGEHRAELTKSFPRSALPQDQEPKEGMMLMIGTPQGQIPARIAKVDKDNVLIDLNHPLAGKKLIFNIKIIDIKSK